MNNDPWGDIVNPKSRTDEFNPNMIFLARNITINVLDEPSASFYIKYDPTSAMAEVGIPQEHFLSMTQKWCEIKGKKLADSMGGVGPIGG